MRSESVFINHSGAQPVTLDQLRNQPDPVRLTETHHPIRHDRFIDLIKKTLGDFNLETTREEYSLRVEGPGETPNGMPSTHGFNDLFGLIGVRGQVSGVEHCLGIRGSNTMNFSRQLGAGNRVFVCDNLCFGAQIVVGRKHTRNILTDLPDLVSDAVNEIRCLFAYDAIRTEVYRESEISDEAAHDVMMQSIQGGNYSERTPASKLSAWVSEWHEPSHDDFKPRNAWSLLNAHTEVAKSWAFDSMSRRTEKVQGIIDRRTHTHFRAQEQLIGQYTSEQVDRCQIALAE